MYLDYAAATPLAPEVLEAMMPYLTTAFYNPSANYEPAREVRRALDDARARIAQHLGARPGTITFTAGATEANNLAFATIAPTAHVVVSALEHPSVLEAARLHPHTLVYPNTDGRIDPQAVADAIKPTTELVSIELANGEIGALQPLAHISSLLKAIKTQRLAAGDTTPLFIHSDATQAAATRSVNVATLGCDMLTLSAAKLYGPKQVGLLYHADDVQLRPLIVGGGQEGGLRSGTENVAGIIGFAAALDLAKHHRKMVNYEQLRKALLAELVAALPDTLVTGPNKPAKRIANVLGLAFRGAEGRRLVLLAEKYGLLVATGSACAASKMKTSHVLEALGLAPDVVGGSVRVSFGHTTTLDEARQAGRILARVVQEERSRMDTTTSERVSSNLEQVAADAQELANPGQVSSSGRAYSNPGQVSSSGRAYSNPGQVSAGQGTGAAPLQHKEF